MKNKLVFDDIFIEMLEEDFDGHAFISTFEDDIKIHGELSVIDLDEFGTKGKILKMYIYDYKLSFSEMRSHIIDNAKYYMINDLNEMFKTYSFDYNNEHYELTLCK